ncbi:AbrB family looped-hinge helix DNA binding protein [Leucobacter komagatae]|uniref:AbrB family looped-hinge helix DNA binding protein n=1 Tax=Leucobacter komagatae TaxID=55969 RepID=A0A542Y7T1_9MICO|nr:antitoxin [Leucobacter komagatae]TQL44168.1 AbrB family looped-hinge helix DNA binding protein [Leucobacter komagatae]
MITTIDKAGRIVVPKRLRDEMGLTPQTPLRIDLVEGKIVIEFEPTAHEVDTSDGLPIIRSERDPGATPITDALVREVLEEGRDERTARFV